jgi:hypothetical protein
MCPTGSGDLFSDRCSNRPEGHVEKTSSIAKRLSGGMSQEEVYVHLATGERPFRHTIAKNGAVVHARVRDFSRVPLARWDRLTSIEKAGCGFWEACGSEDLKAPRRPSGCPQGGPWRQAGPPPVGANGRPFRARTPRSVSCLGSSRATGLNRSFARRLAATQARVATVMGEA